MRKMFSFDDVIMLRQNEYLYGYYYAPRWPSTVVLWNIFSQKPLRRLSNFGTINKRTVHSASNMWSITKYQCRCSTPNEKCTNGNYNNGRWHRHHQQITGIRDVTTMKVNTCAGHKWTQHWPLLLAKINLDPSKNNHYKAWDELVFNSQTSTGEAIEV